MNPDLEALVVRTVAFMDEGRLNGRLNLTAEDRLEAVRQVVEKAYERGKLAGLTGTD